MSESAKKSKLGSLTKKVAKVALKGWNEGLAPQKPFAYYGFKADPFTNLLPDQNTFIEANDPFDAIQRIMAHLSDLYNKKNTIIDVDSYKGHHLIIQGPTDSGKSYLLAFAHLGLSEMDSSDIGDLKTLFIDAVSDWKHFDTPEEDLDPEEPPEPSKFKFQQFRNWLSKNEQDLADISIIFMDNIAAVVDIWDFIIEEILISGAQPLIVVSLSLAELERLKREDYLDFLSYFSEIPFHLHPISDNNLIIELLEKRILKNSTNNSVFTQESLQIIADFCLGLPGLACWLASEVMLHSYTMKRDQITKVEVLHVVGQLGFLKANELIKGFTGTITQEFILRLAVEAAGEARIVTGSKNNRTYAMRFGGGVTNSSLQRTPIVGTKSKSTISHHLKALSDQSNLLRVQKHSKSRIYYLERPILNALEILFSQSTLREISSEYLLQE